ncbi:MAG: hypothetical protein IKP00_01440 [Victivallales bacterium]|nr:hypothetical protein [Victivallales bacterium]
MQLKKSKLAKMAVMGVLSATAAFAASDTLYDYFGSYVEATAGLIPNKLSLSIYQEVTFEDNQDNSPRRDRTGNVGYKTGIDGALTRTKGWVTYGIDGDASYQFWQKDAHEKNAFDWSIAPMVLVNVDTEGSLAQSLKLSISSKSKYEKLSKTDRREARHIDSKLGLAYDLLHRSSRAGAVLTFDYRYDYFTKNDYKNRSFDSWEIGLAPYYKFSGKVKGGVRLSYREKDYRESKTNPYKDDSSKKTIAGYINYDPSLKLNVYAEAGFSRTDFEGRSKDSYGDGDWKPMLKLRIKYKPNTYWSTGFGSNYDFEDSQISSHRGGSYQFDNYVFLNWKPSHKFSLRNTIGIENQNEKDLCNLDTTEYYYNLRATYHLTANFSCYALYKYSNVNYKYVGRDSYFSNDVTLGIKYTF